MHVESLALGQVRDRGWQGVLLQPPFKPDKMERTWRSGGKKKSNTKLTKNIKNKARQAFFYLHMHSSNLKIEVLKSDMN